MATERTFDSQRWAHDARAQAKGTQIQAERSFGDRAAAGAAAVGQGIQQRAQREDRQQGLQQQDRQFQEQREDRREEFSATMEQRQHETELDVEARTKEQELRRLQAESLINRNNALNQALDWDLEDKRKHRELLGYQSEIEMQDLEIARARNAVMRERYELRKFRQMEQAEMMATASEEDVATWARSMRTQGLFSDLEPGEQGPVTTDAVSGRSCMARPHGSALRSAPRSKRLTTWYLYRVPGSTPGIKSSQVPVATRWDMGCAIALQPLNEPLTDTASAAGAHTEKTVPRTPSCSIT